MAGGRPTKYDPKYCDLIVEIMKDGASIEEVAAEFGVTKVTLYEWCDKHVEFFNAKKRAEELSKAWWVKQGRTQLGNKDFSYTGWYMNMKNRFKWSDRQEQVIESKSEVNIKGEVKLENIDDRIKEMMGK